MPKIQLSPAEKATNFCNLCGGKADFYLARQIAPSMFLCHLCAK